MKILPQKRRSRGFCRLAAACAVGVMLMMYGITGRAAQTGTVRSDNVNVRTEASAESNRVCKLSAGTQLAIADQTTGSDGQVWYSVTFTHEGAEKSGWIRSDMVNVSETEEPAEGENPEEGAEGGAISAGGYSIQEPAETYPAADALSETTITVGEQSFNAWVVDAGLTGGRELYLVWALDAGGNQGWFYYDPLDGTFQRDMGQFSGSGSGEPQGMIESLQEELTNTKEANAKSMSQRLYIIIGLGALSGILLIIVIVLSVKLRNAEYEYYDDDEDEDDDEEDEDDDYEEEPKKKRGGLFRRRASEEEDEDTDEIEGSDFDDLLVAVRKKWAEEEALEARARGYKEEEADDEEEDEFYDEEDIEEEDLFSTKELPEIDMSAVLEIEEEAAKEKKKSPKSKAVKPAVKEKEEEADDDLDIEILDFEDLGI